MTGSVRPDGPADLQIKIKKEDQAMRNLKRTGAALITLALISSLNLNEIGRASCRERV